MGFSKATIAVALSLVLSSLQTIVSGSASYFIVFPNKIRQGHDLKINVEILNAVSSVSVTAGLKNDKNETVASATGSFSVGPASDLVLSVPTTLSKGKYELSVNGSGGLTFTNKTDLFLDEKVLSIFIQSDKAIYKAGETVKFRVLATDMNLKVVHAGKDIEIYDPKENKIKVWRMVSGPNGIYQGEMVMSDHPILGDWKIKVKVRGFEEEQIFTVDEYVLPKFEVTVELSKYGLTTDKFLTGTVKATYTYGKPVKGDALITIKPKYPIWDPAGATSVTKSIKLNGEGDFKIGLKEIEKLYQRKQSVDYFRRPPPVGMSVIGSRVPEPPKYSLLNLQTIVVNANVTESLTGKVMTDDSEIEYFKEAENLKFSDNSPNNFKPGSSLVVQLVATLRDGTPWSTNGKKAINVTITYYSPDPNPKPRPTWGPPPIPGIPGPELPLPPLPPLPIQPLVNIDGGMEPVPLRKKRSMIMPYPWIPDIESKQTMMMSIPQTGLADIVIADFPVNCTRISINAMYSHSVSAWKSLSKSQSPSGNYINVKKLSPTTLKAGTSANFEISSTEPVTEFQYKVVSKGVVVISGSVTGSAALTYFSVALTSQMSPESRMVVYYIRDNGEIVADNIVLKIEGFFENEVSMSFSKNQALPGEAISLDITADPGSYVGVLAVDQSVLLLKSGNDISVGQVEEELKKYSEGISGGWNGRFYRSALPWYYGYHSDQAFSAAGLKVFTDGDLPGSYRGPIYYNRGPRPDMMAFGAGGPMPEMARGVAMDMVGSMNPPPPMASNSGSMSNPAARVRKLFPESWLWQSFNINPNGSSSIYTHVPDTITSWVASAFAVHDTSGLGVAPVAAKTKTFKPFFVSLNLPYSVIRDEQVFIQANVFNYLNQDQRVMVTLEYSPDFENIVFFWNSREYQYSSRITRYVRVKAGEVGTAYFPIVPKALGHITLRLFAQAPLARDTIIKKLLVEPEGLPQEYNIPTIIDLRTSTSFTKTIPIELPMNLVPGSARISLSVIGDLIGPSIANIDKLLAMPYGCGEQNMLKFAPNIYITRYLMATNLLTPEIKEKSENFMLKGYQRELTYQRDDGSFSAFGQRDKAGSMWLSSFVRRCFEEAKDLIDIDEKVIIDVTNWMLDQQQPNGSFAEPGVVHHKDMQGGSAKGPSLTAYALISLLEGETLPLEIQARVTQGRNIERATEFIENAVNVTTDPYQLAIMSYALSLAKSPLAQESFDKLLAMAVVKDGMMYWTKPVAVKTGGTDNYVHRPQNAVDIEMTAYNLLTMSPKPGIDTGLQILKWLISQRNAQGGFASTQDTVIALQALSGFASKIYSTKFDVTISVTGTGASVFQKQFTIGSDPLLLQTEEVPSDVTALTVSASGNGISLFEVGVSYNIDVNEFADPSFQLESTVTGKTANSFTLNACAKYLLEGASNMAVLELGIPTGFTADNDTLTKLPTLKQVDIEDRKLVLYFDEIAATPTCVKVVMERSNLAAKVQPVAVRIYDYYENNNQVTVFYGLTGAASPSVCQLCGQACGCYMNMGWNWFNRK